MALACGFAWCYHQVVFTGTARGIFTQDAGGEWQNNRQARGWCVHPTRFARGRKHREIERTLPLTNKNYFNKHKNEFGFASEQEYLNSAKKFIASQGNDDVLVKVRTNGDNVIYNPSTNEFAVTTADGTIRTYFKPKDLDYFSKQSGVLK